MQLTEAERLELQILRSEVVRLRGQLLTLFGMGPDDGPRRVSFSERAQCSQPSPLS